MDPNEFKGISRYSLDSHGSPKKCLEFQWIPRIYKEFKGAPRTSKVSQRIRRSPMESQGHLKKFKDCTKKRTCGIPSIPKNPKEFRGMRGKSGKFKEFHGMRGFQVNLQDSNESQGIALATKGIRGMRGRIPRKAKGF